MTPDLEIRVVTEGKSRLAYVLRYAEGKGQKFDRRIAGPTLQVPPRQYQLMVLKRLELLGDQLGTHDQKLSQSEVEKELAAIGHDLYKELFPQELRDEYSQFRRKIRSLLIVSDEPWIPWEIVKPYSTDGGEPFDDDFLCCEFELTRWLAKGGPLLLEIAASRIAAVEAGAPESARKLRHSSEEVEFLEEIATRHEGVAFQALRDATHPETMELLETGGFGVLLFVGHGEFDANDPEESRFLLNDGRALRPRDLHGPIETTLQHDRPLVFFNSCQVAQQDFSLTRVGGWAARWVCECGCGAFVGPQWSVDDALASLFSRTLFAALEGGATFGQAATMARLAARKAAPGQPSWLAYTIYAHPNGRLLLGAPQSSSVDSVPHSPPSVPLPGRVAASGRRRRRQRRPALPSRVALVGAVLIVLAVALYWRFGDSPEPVPPMPPPPQETPHDGTGSDLPPSTIDISALQKPPYSSHSVSFYIKLPQEVDPSLWRGRIETTADRELTAVGLERTLSTSAVWLFVVEVESPSLSQGVTGRICKVPARFEIYYAREQRAKDSIEGRASQFTDDAACEAALHNVAERISKRAVSAYLDETSEE